MGNLLTRLKDVFFQKSLEICLVGLENRSVVALGFKGIYIRLTYTLKGDVSVFVLYQIHS